MEKPDEGKVIFTGNCGSDRDLITANKCGLHVGRIYEARNAGYQHGVHFIEIINIGRFNSAMFMEADYEH